MNLWLCHDWRDLVHSLAWPKVADDSPHPIAICDKPYPANLLMGETAAGFSQSASVVEGMWEPCSALLLMRVTQSVVCFVAKLIR